MKNKLTLMAAPMDGVLDSPSRQLIRQFSPKELLFGEMRHVNCITRGGCDESLRYDPIEQPLAFQISANGTNQIELALEKILEQKFCMLNLNASCPARNVIKSGSGSALMANPSLLKKILLSLHKALRSRAGFTIKLRAGFKEKNALEIAQLAQDCGVEMIIIHPRTQPGGFTDPLDFDLVQNIKKAVTVPVIFSGEIHSFDDILSTYEKTGADGFMIGRALWGAPWKMHEITCQAEGKDFCISPHEIIKLATKHLDLYDKFFEKKHSVQHFKTHLARYLKGFDGANTLRRKFMLMHDHTQMRNGLEELAAKLS